MVCVVLTIVAFLTQSVPFTLLLAILGYWAAFAPNHPVDLVYRKVARPRFHAPDLVPDPLPRRFACGMAATLLLAGAIAWQGEAAIVGSVFVGMVALSLSALVFADFCMGSFFYWLLVRRRVFRGS